MSRSALFRTVDDQLRSRVLEAETRVVELLAEKARLKTRMEYAESLLRRMDESTANAGPYTAIELALLLTEHKREYPEAWT